MLVCVMVCVHACVCDGVCACAYVCDGVCACDGVCDCVCAWDGVCVMVCARAFVYDGVYYVCFVCMRLQMGCVRGGEGKTHACLFIYSCLGLARTVYIHRL